MSRSALPCRAFVRWDLILPDSFSELSPMADPYNAFIGSAKGRPNPTLSDSITGRFVRAAPGPTERTDSLAFVGISLSCNAAGIPSFLIRKPTCACAKEDHSQPRKLWAK